MHTHAHARTHAHTHTHTHTHTPTHTHARTHTHRHTDTDTHTHTDTHTDTQTHTHTHTHTHTRTHTFIALVILMYNIYRAVAPTPAGQAMAGPVFSLHLAGLSYLYFLDEPFHWTSNHSIRLVSHGQT